MEREDDTLKQQNLNDLSIVWVFKKFKGTGLT